MRSGALSSASRHVQTHGCIVPEMRTIWVLTVFMVKQAHLAEISMKLSTDTEDGLICATGSRNPSSLRALGGSARQRMQS